jgi:hypothetical protein
MFAVPPKADMFSVEIGRCSCLRPNPSFVLRCIADFGRASAWRNHEMKFDEDVIRPAPRS